MYNDMKLRRAENHNNGEAVCVVFYLIIKIAD